MAPLILVVILDVRASARADYHAYETAAAGIMADHEGTIERVISAEGAPEGLFREIHIVRFPDAAGYEAYRNDPRLISWAEARHSAIVSTQVFPGRDLTGVAKTLD